MQARLDRAERHVERHGDLGEREVVDESEREHLTPFKRQRDQRGVDRLARGASAGSSSSAASPAPAKAGALWRTA